MSDQWYQRLPIRQKFILHNVVVSAAALLLMVLVLTGVSIAERVQDSRDSLLNRAMIVADSIAPAVEFADYQRVDQVLALNVGDPALAWIAVTDPNGTITNTWLDPKLHPAPPIHPDPSVQSWLKASHPITVAGEKIGFVTVAADPAFHIAQLAVQLGSALITALICITFAIFFGVKFHKRLARPIANLIITMENIRAGNPSSRATRMGDDELGRFADDFNEMLNELEDQAKRQQLYKQDLEVTVAERTNRLRHQNDWLELLLEGMNDALFAIDHAGKIVAANVAAERLTKLKRNELNGRDLEEFLVFDSPLESQWEGSEHSDAADIFREEQARGREGQMLSVSSSLLRRKGGKADIRVCLVRDVTKLKEYEAELRDARDRALDAAKLKSEFLANVSHEIRTPMNGIMGLTSLILDTKLDDEQREFCESISSCSHSLLHIINDVLDFSKLESGHLRLDLIEFNIYRAIDDIIDLFRVTADEKSIALRATFKTGVPRWFLADLGRLRQIVTNLVNNAIKFTDEGYVEVQVSFQSTKPPSLHIDVIDSGVGMTEETQNRLFQAFQQGDGSITRKYGGTGLGLAISKQLVELMEGSIGVTSELGKGTTFSVQIPVEAPNRQGEDIPRDTVLLCAESDRLREHCRNRIEAFELDVHEATNAAEALVLTSGMAAQAKSYHWVIVDQRIAVQPTLPLWVQLLTEADTSFRNLSVIHFSDEASTHNPGIEHPKLRPFIRYPFKDRDFNQLAPEVTKSHETPKIEVRPRQTPSGRVLIADPNQSTRLSWHQTLEGLGMHTDFAEDGEEALEKLVSEDYVGALLRDDLSIIDGFEVASALKNHLQGRPCPPLILLTNEPAPALGKQCREAGLDAFLSNNDDKTTVLKTLNEWIGVTG